MEKTTRNQFILLILILAIAAFFRFYKLSEVPPGLYPDVAINGNDAATALANHNFRVFYPENNGREGLFINAIAISFAFFGISVWSIKIVAAIIGFLTVLGLYLMIKELFRGKKQNNSIALLSSFFLAVSFWHIVFSRLGFRAIMVPFFLVWGFYFLFWAMRMMRMKHANDANEIIRNWKLEIRNLFYWIFAGLLFGLGFHTYISYRVVPAIWMIVLLIEIYNHWPRFKSFIANSLWCWGIGILAIIFAALPIVLYFYHNPQDFMGRSSQISIFSSGSPVKQLATNTIKTLGMFNVRGDCNWRHNYACQPELFWPVGILFLIGVLLSSKEIIKSLSRRRRQAVVNMGGGRDFIAKSDEMVDNRLTAVNLTGWTSAQISLFLLSWFFALLLPEILSNEGLPHALRAIGAIPPVFIFAGIGGAWLVDRLYLFTSSPQLRGGLGRGADKFITTPPPTPSSIEEGRTNYYLIVVIVFIFCITLVAFTYEYYFIDWGKNPEVQGAYTQYLVDIGNYLNRLPADMKKYVIVNERGVPVPFPNGIPMPAQTIMFITRQTPNIIYLKPEQLQSITDQSIVVLMKYDENILNQLQKMFPRGKILKQNNIWIFEININLSFKF
jgi:4-amino-4-deoxy-L-arabinose transferase-like glycosyltransferase